MSAAICGDEPQPRMLLRSSGLRLLISGGDAPSTAATPASRRAHDTALSAQSVHPRAPALPAHNLFHTVACQFGKLAAVHVGLGHCTRQALADPLLLGSVIFLRHRRASLCPTVAYCKMLGDCRLSRAKDTPRGMRPRRCSGPCRTMRSGSSLEEQTRKTRPQHEHYESLSSQALVVYPCRRTSCSEDRKSFCPTRVA